MTARKAVTTITCQTIMVVMTMTMTMTLTGRKRQEEAAEEENEKQRAVTAAMIQFIETLYIFTVPML